MNKNLCWHPKISVKLFNLSLNKNIDTTIVLNKVGDS